MYGKAVLTTCFYSLGSALSVQRFETDIVKATQPPSVDAIQKLNIHTTMRH